VDETTGNLVNAILALLGIAATVFLAFSARSGARHHLENLKAAGDALEKVHDPAAQTIVERYVARETVKLEDILHPDTVATRRYFVWSAVVYLLALGYGVMDLFGVVEDDEELLVGLGILGAISLSFFIMGALRTHRVSQRRAHHRAVLEAPFFEDDRRRGLPKKVDPD
jgi:hypothetical protein